MTTKIEWVQNEGEQGETWNFLGGCKETSPGCANCYAKYIAHRLAQNPNKKISAKYKNTTRNGANGVVWTGEMNFDENSLLIPLKTKKPTTYFISMSDLFYEKVKDEWIDKAFAVMALTPQHTYQILTKRADRMRAYLQSLYANYNDNVRFDAVASAACEITNSPCADYIVDIETPFLNVWLGVSVENQKEKPRIDLLRQTPAALRFISFEPLLEDLGELDLDGIDWAIVGGESGTKARPFRLEHGLNIIRQCQSAGVKTFFKQAGSNPFYHGQPLKLKNRKGSDLSELPSEFNIRQMPEQSVGAL